MLALGSGYEEKCTDEGEMGIIGVVALTTGHNAGSNREAHTESPQGSLNLDGIRMVVT
jgi:hypothetical protein